MVKVKTRIGGVAELVPNRGAETGLHFSLLGAGGHPTRYCQHCQKPRTQGHRQVDVIHPLFPSWIFLSFFLSFHSCFLFFFSFWGKLGERVNKPTTVTVQDPAHLFRSISDSALDISTLRLCTYDILEAVYTSVKENAVKGTKTNIFIAAFTTCNATLKLYESLDTLQKQVLYYDTDSVVYKWRPGQPCIAISDFLGDMDDELDGDGTGWMTNWMEM